MKKFGNILTAAVLPYLVAYGVQLIASFGIMFIYGIINHEGSIENIANNIPSDLAVLISVLVALINLIIFGLWYKKINLDVTKVELKNKLNIRRILGIILVGVGIQITLSAILNLFASIYPEWFHNYNETMDQLGRGATVLSALYIGLIGPISEEFIFRGLIFRKAQKAFPFIVANMVQALMFGFYHGNLVQGTYAFILGMVLGLVCYKLSIFASILLHIIINISGVLFGYIDTDLLPSSNLVLGLIVLVAIAALIIGMNMILKKEKSSGDMY